MQQLQSNFLVPVRGPALQEQPGLVPRVPRRARRAELVRSVLRERNQEPDATRVEIAPRVGRPLNIVSTRYADFPVSMNDRGHPESPERNLWERVLLIAFKDDLVDGNRNVRRRAQRWFRSRQTGIGSSRCIADVLNLSHSCLVKEAANRRPAPRSRRLELASQNSVYCVKFAF